MRQLHHKLAFLLAGALLAVSLACDSSAPATPPPVVLPTVPPPRVVPLATQAEPTATPVPPSAADQARAAALLDRWGLGNPAAAQGVTAAPMSATAAGDFTALALQRAPVLTPTAGVQIEPALLITATHGVPHALAFAAGNGTDLLVPQQVVWAEQGAEAAILFTWQVAGRPVDPQPFVLLDSTGARRGPVLWTLAAATPPTWAPGGGTLAYLDGSAAGPRMVLVTARGQLRASGPAANLECARCWPDGLWAPDAAHWAYATTAALPAPATPNPFGSVTWRLVVLAAAGGPALFDQQGQAGEEMQVGGWADKAHVQVVLRHPLIPADQITGQAGQWQDTPMILRLDTTPPRLEPQTP